MLTSDLLKWFFMLFVAGPVLAAVAVFRAPLLLRRFARWLLLSAWVANAAATIECVRRSFNPPTGIFLLVAMPFAFFAIIWFGVWRAAARHEYLQTLPPDLRRVEELEDIEHGLEAARKNLAQCERRVKSWLISGDDRERLRLEIDGLQSLIANLEQQRLQHLR
jgi:hypothetical protein